MKKSIIIKALLIATCLSQGFISNAFCLKYKKRANIPQTQIQNKKDDIFWPTPSQLKEFTQLVEKICGPAHSIIGKNGKKAEIYPAACFGEAVKKYRKNLDKK